MLIGLTGLARSGKDSAYQLIKERYDYAERLAFADKMKESIAALFGIKIVDIDGFKTDPHISMLIRDELLGETFVKVSFREFIQKYGTEAHRNIFGENFWVDYTLAKDYDHSNKLVIVTDVRFKSESNRIFELGGHVIKVIRPELEANDPHVSEQGLAEYDFEIFNDSTLLEYKKSLLEIVDFLK